MKYIKSIILCFIIFYLYGCQKNPVIHNIHVDATENHQDTIVLTNYTDFDWDRALFFNDYLTCAYHEKDFIEKTYNFRKPSQMMRKSGKWKQSDSSILKGKHL